MPSDDFVLAFGSAFSLHHEKGKIFLQARGEKKELTIKQTENIGDEFHRFARTARHWHEDSGRDVDCERLTPVPAGRLGGEAHGDD